MTLHWRGICSVVLGISLCVIPTSYPVLAEDASYYETDFIVTAYYSPIPGQKTYILGSLEADRVLNGNGIAGADGTAVYYGMIAAPPEFAFGTQIDLEGLGVGKVHDRGGAIKGNRIDVWMGFGDEGLERAMDWGKRTVRGKVYTPDALVAGTAINPDNLITYYSNHSGIRGEFTREFGLGDLGENVVKLSKYLKFLGYFLGTETNSFTKELQSALIDFQLVNDIIEHRDAFGAGHFGPISLRVMNSVAAEVSMEEVGRTLYPGVKDIDEVQKLQRKLKMLGHLDAEATGVYGNQTVSAVYAFQLAQGIVTNEDSPGAGTVGPTTLAALNSTASMQDIVRIDEKSGYVFSRVMSEGDKGKSVMDLKQKLQSLGYLSQGPVDNFFDEATKNAIILFQEDQHLLKEKELGIEVTGVVDLVTANLLAEATTVDRIELDSKEIYRINEVLFFGNRYPQVVKLKKKLELLGYAEYDSYSDLYDTKTKEALFEFQKEKGIVKSENDLGAGHFGPQTMEAFNSQRVSI